MNRRQMIAGLSGLAIVPRLALAAPANDSLTAEKATIPLVPGDYPETAVWGFNGGVPGPEIRLTQGARVKQKLLNNLTEPTSVHWHGLRIPNAMDGVPGMTQEAVAPGQSFSYDFTPPDAGTYWYHSHNRSTEQVARGLYGLLIVDEIEPPEVDHDISVIVDDWRLSQQAAIIEDFGASHDWTHAGRMGNFIHARLSSDLAVVKQNQRLRLRLVNVATDRVMALSLVGMSGHIVALDGMPLRVPEKAGRVVLGPAQRADVIVDVTAETGEQAAISFHERDQAFTLAQFEVTGVAARAPRPPATALPPNPLAYLTDLGGARAARLNMEGGAMGGLRKGIYKGEQMDVQALVDKGQIWTFNGVAGLPDKPLAELSLGELLRIPMRNNTAFPHAMHLHGHHFQEVLPDGSLGPQRDTIMLDRNESREIAFRADNPGDWLFHCHMLSHQAAGMTTWISVNA